MDDGFVDRRVVVVERLCSDLGKVVIQQRSFRFSAAVSDEPRRMGSNIRLIHLIERFVFPKEGSGTKKGDEGGSFEFGYVLDL